MLFRRVAEKLQNFSLIKLIKEFLFDVTIVIVGIGLTQLFSNWIENQNDKEAYNQALLRLEAERTTNIITLRSKISRISTQIEKVNIGLNILLSCDVYPDANTEVNRAISAADSTTDLKLQITNLLEITENPKLLQQQSPSDRLKLAKARYRVEFMLSEGAYAEDAPFDFHASHSPSVIVLPKSAWPFDQNELDPTRISFYGLGTTVAEACNDQVLIKSLATWNRWQSHQLNLLQSTLDGYENFNVTNMLR